MKEPHHCEHCSQTYDLARSELCPYCGKSPVYISSQRSWGGKRRGAGAPQGNLNRLSHGHQSKLLRIAVEKLAADPELRAFLLLLARAATQGELPQTTKKLITRALGGRPLIREAASIRLKKLRGVNHA